MITLNENIIRQIVAESIKKVLKESEYTDDYIDYQMRMNRPISDAEWLKRVGSWSDKIKFELGLVDKLGVAPKYPSTTEEIDALATKAKKMYEYYTDPKRANDRNCELRARALKKIINDCEDRLTNPMPYVEKQNTLANNEYDKRTTNLRTGDKQKQLRTYAFPKDKTQQPYVEPDEKSSLIDVDKKPMFPHNFDEMQEQKSIHINPENKGKFNATKQRTGKSTEELTHSKNPLTRKRAIFAQNAKRWNKNK